MNDALISLFTLTILAGKTSPEKQGRARSIGLLMGMFVRIILLFGINWIQRQDHTLFSFAGHDFSGMALLLIAGGLFLLFQSVREIHLKMRGETPEVQEKGTKYNWTTLMLQMLLINVVFSLDSVITAVGMAKELWVMIAAVVISMIVMLIASKPIAEFVNANPSIKILALSFLVLIGVSLLGEAFEQHINKGYIYFAMAFSFSLEIINLRIDRRAARKNTTTLDS